jgi:biotin carboxyl carrier protein
MLKKFRVSVDGHPYDVTVELPDEAVAAPPMVAPPVSAATPPPVVVPPPVSAPKAVAPVGPGIVPSPLAGRVTQVAVKEGQEVKQGDHLLTLEAMKMNTLVLAPNDGKVSDIKAAVGDAVEEGQALMSVK